MSKWDDVVSGLQAASDAMVGLSEEGTRSETLPKHISKVLGLAIKCRKTANSRDTKAAERVAKLTDRAARIQELLKAAQGRIARANGTSAPDTQATDAPSTDQPQEPPADVVPSTDASSNGDAQEQPPRSRRKREMASA